MIAENSNQTLITQLELQLPKSTLYWFFISIAAAQVWVIYLTFYNSRVLGLILTAIANKLFKKYGHIRIGSFSFSVLSGKIIFRDVHFINEDFSVRVQFGWFIFKWWRPYTPRGLNEDFSHLESRLTVYLEGLELHIFNRSWYYGELEKLFGLKGDTIVPQDVQKDEESGTNEKRDNVPNTHRLWRDLIPVTKINMTSGRFVFGNHLVPNTLVITFEEASFAYTTKPASTPFDMFMHDAKGVAETFKVMLVPSPKYQGQSDEAPRFMGEGFTVIQSRTIDVHYYMDEPGLVPHEPEIVELADGETVVRRTYPCIGLDIKCGKNTDVSYGPWADRQREQLWKFFYPPNYQPLVPTKLAEPGEKRQYRTFEFRMSTTENSTIDILFTKNAVTQAIHMNTGHGTYIEANIPWLTEDDGYVSKVKGQLLLVDCTTSLQYRSLIECETFEFTVTAAYPTMWNDHQDWTCDFIACKATLCLIFHHKHFFKDLIEDWSVKTIPDLYHFVPYTWTMNLLIKDFELVTLVNEYNWIDTSSQNPENAHIAFTGEILDLSLVLPFTDYLPQTVHVTFAIKGENAFCKLYLPENNTSRHIIQAISESMKIMDRHGGIIDKPFDIGKKTWKRFTDSGNGWTDCWRTTHVTLSIGYTYHPMPILAEMYRKDNPADMKGNISSPDLEEALLIPLRPIRCGTVRTSPPDDFDPADMESDLIAVELEVAPSMLCIYGSLLRNFLHLKENYVGEDQVFTDMWSTPTVEKIGEAATGPLTNLDEDEGLRPFDAREYRPFAVTVSVTIHDIHAHLVKNCNIDGLPCPSIYLERLCFEMDKHYTETKLQLLLSPAILVAKDTFERDNGEQHLNEGHLGLSGLQVRGHAMFSHEGLPLESETLEYAWMVEAIIGDLTGKLTCPQLQNLVEFIQTFIVLVEDPENDMTRPIPYTFCQHMLPQPQCRMLPQYPFHCPSSDQIKYRMTRVSMDSINFFLVESGTALNVQLHPVKLSTCNLHGTNTRAGITARIDHISFKQYISAATLRHSTDQPEIWLESGGLALGPIDAEAAMALPNPDYHSIQDSFLKLHDNKTKRLWFIWPQDVVKISHLVIGRCGCVGGSKFFGNNKNGIAFFHVRRLKEKPMAAVLQVSPEGQDPGFGQSLLFKDKLVFDVLPSGGSLLTPSVSRGFAFTRGYMSDIASPDSPSTNVTLVADHPSQTSSVDQSEGTQNSMNRQLTVETTSSMDTKSVTTISSEQSDRRLASECTSLSGEGWLPTPTSDTASFISRKSSLDGRSNKESAPSQSPSNVSIGDKRGSKASIVGASSPDVVRRASLKGSIPSPRLIRQDMGGKVVSAASLESERYYSAEEDVSSQFDYYSAYSLSSLNSTLKGSDNGSPLHMNKSTALDDSNINQTVISANKTLLKREDSTESDTSTVSYEMAQSDKSDSSENDEDILSGEMPPNFSLVDLHSQVNKPITQSPILMSCYSKHLSQFICSDWSVSSPGQQTSGSKEMNPDPSVYSLSSVGQSVQYVHSPACVPHFIKTSQGFTTGLMVLKDTVDKGPPSASETTSGADPWSPAGESEQLKEEEDPEATLLQNASITTAVVKLKGSMDVMVTPLFLESFQRYAEAVIPTLQLLHPSSIIDGLHSQCLDRLKRQNRLKKGKLNSDSESEHIKKVAERQFSTESRTQSGEMKTSSIQALFTLSKINICVLQSGIVEEIISFSALENINELTCTSILAVCIDDVNCQLLSNSHSCKTMLDSSPASNAPTAMPSPKKHTKFNKNEAQPSEKEEPQVSEICREEDVGTLHISRVHLQLQRVLKDSNYSEDVLLTAIPYCRSKVLFKFDKDIPLSGSGFSFSTSPKRSRRGSSSAYSPKSGQRSSFDPRSLSRQSSKDSEGRGATLPRLFRQTSIDEDSPARPKLRKQSRSESFRSHREEGIGFIMFECGLENINATAVRRLGFKDLGDTEFMQKMEHLTQKLGDIQSSTKKQLERDLGRFEMEEDVVVTGLSGGPTGSSDSLHSWDSRISIPSSASSMTNVEAVEPLKGDASSGILDLNTIWFNFAAPPPISITRKVDFTKLDWNLLSTATPAINAWLSPFDRLMISIRTLVLTLTHRTSTVMACVMTDALEVPGIQLPYRSKYGKITSLSRTLQEDPSCQLLCVLRKFLHKVGTEPVEKAVRSDTLPQLITVQKGILALTRQWKNVLYMPHLSVTDFKSRKNVRPYTVSFAVPADSTENIDREEGMEDGDQFDIIDEKASLLPTDGESIHKSTSIPSLSGKFKHGDSNEMHGSVSGASFKVKRPHLMGNKSNTLSPPIIHEIFDSPERRSNIRGGSKVPPPLVRNDSNYSFHSAAASLSSMDQTPPATPLKTDFPKQSILKNKIDKSSDLYQWMAQQGEFIMDHDRRSFKRQDSILGEFSSNWSQDDSRFDLSDEQLTMATSIMQLADAQSLFKPFLQSISLHVESVRPSAMMKKFGGSLSLQSKLDFLKIQIADSDRRSFKGKGKKTKRHPRINLTAEMPAFCCEDFSVNIAMKDVIDFESKISGDNLDKGSFSFPFAMHKLEAKPTTLQVNFMINCQAVTQHVDMPLLRLIHQFVTMAENVKDTRKELKQSHTQEEWIKTHRKQDSKDSTSSADTQHSDISQTGGANSPPPTDLFPSPPWKTQHAPGTPTHQRAQLHMETPLPTQSTAKKMTLLSHKTSFSSFRNPFEQIRPEKLSIPIKKPHLFAKDGKKTRTDSTENDNLNKPSEILTPPQSLNLSDSVTIEMEDTSSPSVAEKTIVDEIKETTPKCWRSLYHLLELYSTMPETKTVKRKPKLPVIEEEPEGKELGDGEVAETPSDTSKLSRNRVDNIAAVEEGTLDRQGGRNALATSSFNKTSFRQSIYVGESIPLVVFGIAKIEKVKILAVLSGLKLEAELKNVHASGTYQEKVKGFLNRKSSESSATAHIGNTMIVLLEGLPPEMKTVVTVKIDKSQALHTTILRRGKEHNSAMVSIGAINIDIPQHPVVLHDMMARSTRQLSTTLQEFRRPVSRTSRNLEPPPELGNMDTGRREATVTKEPPKPKKEMPKTRPTFLHIHIKAVLQGLTTGASLLPSLKAQHKTGPITLSGITGKKARFTVDLPNHTLSFKSKVMTTETSIPSSASIDLPPIHMYGDYRHHKANASVSETLTEGLALKEGGYLNAVAEVGMLEHSLTTDLLNHLVFVQKVFMKEVNELLQKVSGSDKPVPIWSEDEQTVNQSRESILYSLLFRFKGIQITATTPTSSAVRLETGSVDLEISNRVQMATRESNPENIFEDSQKMFIKAQIDLNLALGQLLKNPMFEEAEPEFQTMAFFKTKIGIRNALQDEMIPGVSAEQEALLITLTRPIILAHPLAFDKAVLVWLNYKNAYEYWTEQRMALNHEVQKATRQVMDRIPQITSTNAPATLSTLFLQLTVNDMGICVPATSPGMQAPQTSRYVDNEPGSALVLTIKSTQISACSSGSLVSKGRFQDFCLRFADDFETSWDDWKPNAQEDPVMNACVVPEGTYEVCSRTINKLISDPSGNAKWILNVQWKMQGIDVHLDTNIGKRLSGLGHTLTALAGEPDEEYMDEDIDDSMPDIVSSPTNDYDEPEISPRRPSTVLDVLPSFVYDTSLDPKHRFRLIEKEMNEQAKIVQDLKQLGASQSTIETESRKLEELKGIVFQDFRREVLNKIKKQSESRTSALKDQLGIGNRPPHIRSKSFGGPIPGRDRRSHIDSEKLAVYNQELTNRGVSLDISKTLPPKVQFGNTLAYSPPETPDSLPATLGRSSSLYAEYLKDSPTLEQEVSDLLDSSSTDSSLLSDSEGKSATLTKDSVFKTDTDSTSTERLQPKNGLSSPSSLSIASGSKTVPEPNIDFELDVKVFIDSGKCVLHPKESKDDELRRQQQKREKTPTLDTSLNSPNTKRKLKKQDTPVNLAAGSAKKQQQQAQQPQIETPVFFIPSVDVKVHYNSKTTGGGEITYQTDQDKFKSDIQHTEFDDATLQRKNQYPYNTKQKQDDIPEDGEEDFEPVVMRRRGRSPPASLPELVPQVSDDDVVMMRKKRSSYRPPNPSPEDGVEEEVLLRKRPTPPELLTAESTESRDSTWSIGKKGGVKKANLYAWLSLQSLPEEMVISPCLLDFLEQALEPIEFSLYGQTKKMDAKDTMLNLDLDGSYSSLTTSPIFGSFPVDVVVFLRVEPSIIRFNCLPSSRVECLLQVPSLEFVFSTKGPDIECPVMMAGTPPMKTKVPKSSRERNLSGGKTIPENRSRASSTTSCADQSGSVMSSGGLSITGGLSDFSLYIFHPYGGGQRKIVPSSPVYPSTIRHQLGSIQEHGTTLADMARRDMLSLNVEFVKINISRSRKLESGKSDLSARSNVVRFSAVLDIGSAAFKYDMRRLSEILSFPKSWYRRNLARRLFLGDDSFMQAADEDLDSSSSSGTPSDWGLRKPVSKFFSSIPAHLDGHDLDSNKLSPPRLLTHHRRASSGDKMKLQQISTELKNEIVHKSTRKGSVSAPQSPTEVSSLDGAGIPQTGTPKERLTKQRSSISQSETPKHKRHASGQKPAAKASSSWETLVLFAVNVSRLDLNVNMSNVMGNTVWTTKQIKSHGRLSIDSSGHKNMKITAGMSSSHFDSRGGVVGGNLDINDLNVFFEVHEDPELGKEPDHRAGLVLQAIECRMDYMGTSVLMTRLSTLDILLHDEWHIDTATENDEPLATNRPAVLFAHGELKWDKFHMMISRSTTPDIVKMVSKIEEFFTQQFTSSKRVLSAFGPIHGGNKRSDRRKMSEDGESFWDIRHHRHWQKALELVTGCRFSMLPTVIPKEGMILGGNMSFVGNNLALACFHGINFRAKSWAIFSVLEPYILFSTEAQKTPEQESHIIQDLTFYIGHDLTQIKHGKSMSTICKLSRGHSMPPTFTSVQEWFHYAFSTPDVKGLDDFPQIIHQDLENQTEYRRSRKSHDYNHESEMIFALPSLQMHLKSIHKQSEHEPQPDDPKPVVECSFITEFEDHIFVAMDAEVILFLHDLVSLYIKEKDIGVSSVYGQAAKAAKSPDSEKKKVTDPTTALKQDWREFECNTWQLEPTVRLLHWASKQIDPVGVDYVLQKLGFTHARVTIPKWMQRGFMDPMDKVSSFLIEKLISILKEKPEDLENS